MLAQIVLKSMDAEAPTAPILTGGRVSILTSNRNNALEILFKYDTVVTKKGKILHSRCFLVLLCKLLMFYAHNFFEKYFVIAAAYFVFL